MLLYPHISSESYMWTLITKTFNFLEYGNNYSKEKYKSIKRYPIRY